MANDFDNSRVLMREGASQQVFSGMATLEIPAAVMGEHTRSKESSQSYRPAPVTEQLPTGDGEEVLAALRANQQILNELALRYGVAPASGADRLSGEITSAQHVHDLLGPEMVELRQEQLRLLLLDNKNRVISQRVIYQGTINTCNVRVAEILRPAIVESSPQIIICHNHPSGAVTPSPEDNTVTRRLIQAGQLLDIELLDHVVIGREGFISMREQGRVFDDVTRQGGSGLKGTAGRYGSAGTGMRP